MKKLIVLFFVVVAAVSYGGFKNRGYFLNEPVVMNKQFDEKTVAELWGKIKRLDRILPIDEEITLYLNSNGGLANQAVVLLSRIDELQKAGRKFTGVIYGNCFSACGSLFSIMNYRYATKNAIYGQHLANNPNIPNSYDIVSQNLDSNRLIYDAAMLRMPFVMLREILKMSDVVLTADQLLKFKNIIRIVPQPDIDEV